MKALRALCDESLISVEECDLLSRAYMFLRDVENKLQMANDAQTHSLPQEGNELDTCIRTLGYASTEMFLREYRSYTAQVSSIFERRFSQHLL